MKKMVMAIVPLDRGEQVLYELVNSGYTATFAETQGGILRQSQLSLFIAIEEDRMDTVLQIVRETGATNFEQNDDAFSSGTIIFVWDLSQVEVC